MSDNITAVIHGWIRDVLPFAAKASLTPGHVKALRSDVAAQIDAAVAAEREACARIADAVRDNPDIPLDVAMSALSISDAIRAMGTE